MVPAPLPPRPELTQDLPMHDLLSRMRDEIRYRLAVDSRQHMMNQEFSDPSLDEKFGLLLDDFQAILDWFDYDPTPNHLWDDTGGEPPLSANERMAAAHQQHLEAHS